MAVMKPATSARNFTPNSTAFESSAAAIAGTVVAFHKLQGHTGGRALAVGKDQLKVVARALPATSFTPLAPPTTVAVYCAPLAKALLGVKVALLVLAL